MPPKAKAKAKALPKAKGKAKARPKIGARPAAFLVGGRLRPRRRPAAAEVEEPSPEFRFNSGEEVCCEDVGPFAWTPDLWVSLTGQYWGGPAKVAGFVQSYTREGSSHENVLRATGTTHERLQKWSSTNPGRPLRIHLCSKECGGEKVADDYFHAHYVQKIALGAEEAWMKSLELGGDEMPDLRRALGGDKARGLSPEGEVLEKPPAEEDKEAKKKEKKRKKKELKNREKEGKKEKKLRGKEEKEKRKEDDSDSTSSSSKETTGKNAAKKALSAVFGRTGLDPSPKVRMRLRRRVRKSLRKNKKKKKDSSAESSEESSSSMGSGSHLFQENKKVKVIGSKMPGALTAQSVEEMQESLLTASGQVWNMQEGAVQPVAVHYFRSVLQPRMTGGIAREALTLSTLVDMALQGRIAESVDIAIQRLKSLELVSRGSDFRIAQRMELCPLELDTMASSAERREAIQESREESKLRYQSGKGGDYWKGEWKGGSKDWGKKGDGKKGKKGSGKDEDRGKGSGDGEKKK